MKLHKLFVFQPRIKIDSPQSPFNIHQYAGFELYRPVPACDWLTTACVVMVSDGNKDMNESSNLSFKDELIDPIKEQMRERDELLRQKEQTYRERRGPDALKKEVWIRVQLESERERLEDDVRNLPATSAPVERILSHVGLFTRPYRARLGQKGLSNLAFEIDSVNNI